MVSSRSPKPPEELAELGDEELLAYINDWQEEQIAIRTTGWLKSTLDHWSVHFKQ